jgi:hypothetical protein
MTMATVATLRKTTKGQDERAELRRAIESANAARTKLEARQTALAAAREHVVGRQTKLETVGAATTRAQETYGKRVAAALSAGKEPPAPTVMRDARVAVESAEMEHDVILVEGCERLPRD